MVLSGELLPPTILPANLPAPTATPLKPPPQPNERAAEPPTPLGPHAPLQAVEAKTPPSQTGGELLVRDN